LATFLEEIAEYARIDTAEENIQSFVDSAEAYLLNAGIAKNESSPIYKLAVKMLVTFWYDNRIPSGDTTAQPFGLAGLITQLQYCPIETAAVV